MTRVFSSLRHRIIDEIRRRGRSPEAQADQDERKDGFDALFDRSGRWRAFYQGRRRFEQQVAFLRVACRRIAEGEGGTAM